MKKKNIKKIRDADDKCLNEIEICKKVCDIPFFYNYFNPILKSKNIGDAVIVDDVIDTNIKNGEQILIWKRDMTPFIDFHDFFTNLKTPKDIIVYIIDSYKELLESIKVLNDKKICYFDLKMDKIVFDKFGKPILDDFEEGIDYNNIKFLNSYVPSYYVWPLEVNIIHYLNQNDDIKSLSRTNIEEICKEFIIKNKGLAFFPENYIVSYYKNCVEFLIKYINIPKNEIIKSLSRYISTWDNYSLSIVYLQLLYILRIHLKDLVVNGCGFFGFFSRHLFSQINPDPEKRPNIIETQKNFNNIFVEDIDWFYLSENMDDREIHKGFIDSLIDVINHTNKIIMECTK